MRRRLNSPNTSDVEAKPLLPEEMEHPRPIPSTVRIWAPDGHSELHTRINAADLCRRPGPGQAPWTYTPPGKEEEEAVAAETAAGRRRPAAAAAPPAEPAPPTELFLLREEARALGLPVEANWGKKRLRDEIAAASNVSEKDENVDTFDEHARGDDISDDDETI